MHTFYRKRLILLLIIFVSSMCCAFKSMKQGDAVITMRGGQPCFSYPQDEVIKKNPYSFNFLSVSELVPFGGDGWTIQAATPEGKGLLEPNNPAACIKYGGPHPGTKDWFDPAKPLKMNTPYQVGIVVAPKTSTLERRYTADFCLTRDGKGNKTIVSADIKHENKITKWVCLKPGEKPKRSFWEWLFGK